MKTYTKLMALVAVLLVIGLFILVANNTYVKPVKDSPVSTEAPEVRRDMSTQRISQSIRIVVPKTIKQTITVSP